MDELERLVGVYRARASSSAKSRVGVLMDLERIRDPRVVPFLLQVLRDPSEAEAVRMYVLKLLRSGTGLLVPNDRPVVAQVIRDVLNEAATEEIRLQAALALGEFTQIAGVLGSLGTLSLAQEESIDLRYAAFTSLERAGPTSESTALLRQIARDATLGDAARSVLSAWHLDLQAEERQ